MPDAMFGGDQGEGEGEGGREVERSAGGHRKSGIRQTYWTRGAV